MSPRVSPEHLEALLCHDLPTSIDRDYLLDLHDSRAENADLRRELEAANERIAELDALLDKELYDAKQRERAEKLEAALRHLSASADTLSPQEFINVCADALGVDRHAYAGECNPNRSLVEMRQAERELEAAREALRHARAIAKNIVGGVRHVLGDDPGRWGFAQQRAHEIAAFCDRALGAGEGRAT